MRIAHGLAGPALLPTQTPAVVALGNFDALHRGHQSLLSRLTALAPGRPRWLVTFEPLPAEHFAALNSTPAISRLTTQGERLALLAGSGLVDGVLVLRFDRTLATLAAVDFVRLLLARLPMHTLVTGADFRFGAGREGDVALLQHLGTRWGFAAEPAPLVAEFGARISSSRIRQLLQSGEFAAASALLGRHYALRGAVRVGRQLGRTLGFPTVNLPIRHRQCVLSGVYAARVWDERGWLQGWPAVVNVGSRPTVDGGTRRWLEAHLLDLATDTDLYGERLWVAPLQSLRAERRFVDLGALKAQIAADTADARAFFKHDEGPAGSPCLYFR